MLVVGRTDVYRLCVVAHDLFCLQRCVRPLGPTPNAKQAISLADSDR